MSAYFYIKSMGRSNYQIGVARSLGQARVYQGRGRLTFYVKGWNYETVLPWLRFAEKKLKYYKNGKQYYIPNNDAKPLKELKTLLRPKTLTGSAILLHRIMQGSWYLYRAWVWLLFAIFRPSEKKKLIRNWEAVQRFPMPPHCKTRNGVHRFEGFEKPEWLEAIIKK